MFNNVQHCPNKQKPMPTIKQKQPKPRAIQFLATQDTVAKVDRVAGMLRSNRAHVVSLAVDTILDMIESGGAVVVNGKVDFQNPKAA